MKGDGNRRMGNKGYSLVELLTVLAIMAILSVLGIGYLTGFGSRYKLDRAANELVSKLRLAQMKSITTNTAVVVEFDTANRLFKSYYDKNKNGAKDAGENYLILESGREYTAGEPATDAQKKAVWGVLPDAVTMPAATFAALDPPRLRFNPPAGLVDTTLLPIGADSGVVCFSRVVSAEDKNIDDNRRVSIRPLVGTITLWKSTVQEPGCSTVSDVGWEKVNP
jgi:prepilin-type N-terminal cleavage/methylation domain-containing protein